MDEVEAERHTNKCFVCRESGHIFKKYLMRNPRDERDIDSSDVAAGTSFDRHTRDGSHDER